MGYRTVAPFIRWGANHQNAAYFGFPLDNVTTWSEPRQGSEFVQLPSALETAWLLGYDQILEGDLRWLPPTDTLFYPRATGWNFNANTPGLRQFLEWARQKQLFTFIPDGRNLLLYPTLTSATVDYSPGTSGSAGWTTGQNGTPSGVTNAFNGGEPAWQTTGTGVGAGCSVYLHQLVPCIAGETFLFSCDYKASGLTGGANGFIQIDMYTAALSYISTICLTTGLTATSYTRAASAAGVTPANSCFANCLIGITVPNATAGTIFFRNAMVRRDSSDPTFIDTSYVFEPYWVDPQVVPTPEPDGSRKLHIKLRQQALDWLGY